MYAFFVTHGGIHVVAELTVVFGVVWCCVVLLCCDRSVGPAAPQGGSVRGSPGESGPGGRRGSRQLRGDGPTQLRPGDRSQQTLRTARDVSRRVK